MADLRWNRAFALEQVENDEELLKELLDLFRESSRADLERLCQAVEAGDAKAAAHAAHGLKGAAASLGMEAINQLARQMEEESGKGSLALLREMLPALRALIDQLDSL